MQIEVLSKRVADKLNISYDLAEEICRSEFKFILEMIKQKKTINCIHLGKFYTNKKYNEDGKRRIYKHIPRIQKSNI